MLKARQVNWGLRSWEAWESRTWHIWSDRSYTVRIAFAPEQEPSDYIEKTGKMQGDRFDKLCEALDQDWTASECMVMACDGDAWQIDQFSSDGTILRSNGQLEYIYGAEKKERIAALLPGKSFIRDNCYIN